jgi:tRNA nucleotidyltransferase (CCA-adding enzyme)
MDINIFTVLAMLFNKNGYRLYMVGGTARDYLLELPLDDFDLATDATPAQMELFLSDGDYRYSNYGNVKIKVEGHRVDITTLREEAGYKDYRHPQSISFVTDIALDYPRRDFTINAIYIDEKLQIHDFETGIEDLKNKIIKTIGEPNLRLQEDPLRIIRALRFKMKLDFCLEQQLKRAIINNIDMLDYLKPEKVNSEINKMNKIDEQKTRDLLLSFGLKERY